MIFTGDKKNKATITVFLSFTLFFLLAFILITIEGARISVAKVFVERALMTAMDSALAEFYGPLMDEYHILGLDSSYGTSQEQDEILLNKIKDYITYTIWPNYNIYNNLLPKGIDLYDININTLDLKEKTRLMDYDGEIFIHEAVEYMKYKELGDLVQGLRQKLFLIEDTGKISAVYKEKQKIEEELVQIDKNILRLMTLLDGIKTGQKGIKTSKSGQLMVEKYFVKKICIGEPSMDMVAINNEVVYKAIENQYVDVSLYFNKMDKYLSLIIEMDQFIQSLEEEYDEAYQALDFISVEILELSSMDDKSDELIKQLDALIEERELLEERLSMISQDLSFYDKQRSQYRDGLYQDIEYIEDLIHNIKPLLNKTLHVLNDISRILPKAKGLIDKFEDILSQAKDNIGEDIFNGLEEGFQDIKSYIGKGDLNGYDFQKMIRVTEVNSNILDSVSSSLNSLKESLNNKNYGTSRYYLSSSLNEITQYNIGELSIDYSTLVLQENMSDPIESIGNSIKDGLLSLVMDANTLSQLKIEAQHPLPSELRNLYKSHKEYNIGDLFLNMEIGNDKTGISDALEGFQSDIDLVSMIEQGISAMAETFLFIQYLMEHFYYYGNENEGVDLKPSELRYELEYLLIGKDKDRENISSTVTKLIFIRTILNFISVLGDSSKRREAKVIATALVGFTGLPILVNITQTIMMLLLAFIEALVDSCGMLTGKSVPILKNGSEILMDYEDVFLLNYNYVKGKASLIKERANMAMNYKDFIHILLFMKDKEELTFRAMDLIQENLHIRYEDNFNFLNCYYGLKVSLTYIVHSKFTRLSFLKKLSNDYDISGYLYETKASYSY